MKKLLFLLFSITLLVSCKTEKRRGLAKIGPQEITLEGDTIFHKVVDFNLYNQNGEKVSIEKVKGKVHVAEFFFSRCPSICPAMKTQMGRIQEAFKDVEDFHILSFTVDPENDTIQKLSEYAEHLGVLNSKWDLLTGSPFQLQNVASRGYYQLALEDTLTLNHSQNFVLVDKDLHIRGLYNGIDSVEVDTLIMDIKRLLK